MDFEIIGDIQQVETIAVDSHIRDLSRLQKIYSIGRKDIKIKRYLD